MVHVSAQRKGYGQRLEEKPETGEQLEQKVMIKGRRYLRFV